MQQLYLQLLVHHGSHVDVHLIYGRLLDGGLQCATISPVDIHSFYLEASDRRRGCWTMLHEWCPNQEEKVVIVIQDYWYWRVFFTRPHLALLYRFDESITSHASMHHHSLLLIPSGQLLPKIQIEHEAIWLRLGPT